MLFSVILAASMAGQVVEKQVYRSTNRGAHYRYSYRDRGITTLPYFTGGTTIIPLNPPLVVEVPVEVETEVVEPPKGHWKYTPPVTGGWRWEPNRDDKRTE